MEVPTFNTFVSLDGGVVNGDLRLGGGRDTLVVKLGTGSPGQLAGVTGTITGGQDSTLVYLVEGDNSTTLAQPSGIFSTIGYQLSNNANLRVTAASPVASGVQLAGNGTVDFNIDLSNSANNSILVGGNPVILPGFSTLSGSPAPNAITAVSRGTLTQMHNDPSRFAADAVWVLDGNSFTNKGLIIANDLAPSPLGFGDGLAGIGTAGMVTNDGSIQVGGATGIQDMSASRQFSITNNGSISQISGALDGTGIDAVIANVTNNGTISTGDSAVVLSRPFSGGFATLVNNGTLSSVNAPTVLSANEFSQVRVENKSTGVINAGSGQAAVSVASRATVDNAGTINGNVLLGTANISFPFGSTYIARGGTISGDLIFGNGNDSIQLLASSLGVSGRVDGGAGTDSLLRIVTEDSSFDLSGGLGNFINFESLAFDLANDAKLTLSGTGPQSLGIALAGKGSADISANLAGDGSTSQINMTQGSVQTTGDPPQSVPTQLAVVSSGNLRVTRQAPVVFPFFVVPSPLVQTNGVSSFTNKGAITFSNQVPITNPNFLPELAISGGANIVNDGTISVAGAGAIRSTGSFSSSGAQSVVNNGSIAQIAGGQDGTGVTVFNATFTNNGSINTGGAAVMLGQTNGQFGLINNGLISSSNADAVTTINDVAFARIVNSASGVINGAAGKAAIALAPGAMLDNAGTINGDVLLNRSSFPYGFGSTYIARGGTINGNLTFGEGSDFVQVLGDSLGVSGVIDGGAGTDSLFRIITQDTSFDLSAGLGNLVNFEALAFDLSNDAKLTLTGTGAQSVGIGLAGKGSVTISADLSGNGTTPLINMALNSVQTSGDPPQLIPTKLDVVSNGNLAVTGETLAMNSFPTFPSPLVQTNSDSSFTNKGTITYNNLAPVPNPNFFPASAIFGGGSVVNDGEIKVAGVAGINATGAFGSVAQTVINNGRITQIATGQDAKGVLVSNASFTNNGTISTGGSAVVVGQNFRAPGLTNNGTISSSNAVAVSSGSDFSFARVINSVNGVINGAPGRAAVGLSPGSVLDNAGTINGDVNLGQSSFPYGFGSTYIARGGTIAGNLTFGVGADTLVVTGEATGVSGTIDGGAGIDTFIKGYTTNTTIDAGGTGALPSNFERLGIGAVGRDVVVTVNGPAEGLNVGLVLFGDGTIVNRANINAMPNPDPFAGASPNFSPINIVSINQINLASPAGTGLNFVNEARLDDGVFGNVRGLRNSGTIGNSNLRTGALNVQVAGTDRFDFVNTGTIQRGTASGFNFDPAVIISPFFVPGGSMAMAAATLNNSGTITGGVSASLSADDFAFTNSGTITALRSSFFSPSAVSLGQFAATDTQTVASWAPPLTPRHFWPDLIHSS